ncbi:MAG: hypothetical protein ACXU8O_03010 [Asticcacaulis sp.]
MSSRGSFSLGKALSAAGASLPRAWAGAWLVLILLWAVLACAPFLLAHVFSMPHFLILALGGWVVIVLLKLMAQGALYRTALFGKGAVAEGRGFGGLQLGAAEWRLLGASLLVMLFMLLIAGATLIVLAVAFNLSGLGEGYATSVAALHAAFMRHNSAADWIFIVLVPAALLFLVSVSVRFVLFAAATVAEKRMVTLNALGLSTRNAGKLFMGLVIVVLPFVVIAHLLLGAAPGFVMHHDLAIGGMGRHLWVHAAMAALAVGVLLPLQVGFLASAYGQIVKNRAD